MLCSQTENRLYFQYCYDSNCFGLSVYDMVQYLLLWGPWLQSWLPELPREKEESNYTVQVKCMGVLADSIIMLCLGKAFYQPG
jgi:hypothetical protein